MKTQAERDEARRICEAALHKLRAHAIAFEFMRPDHDLVCAVEDVADAYEELEGRQRRPEGHWRWRAVRWSPWASRNSIPERKRRSGTT